LCVSPLPMRPICFAHIILLDNPNNIRWSSRLGVGLTTTPCKNLLSRNLTQNMWGSQSSTRTVAPWSK
jgi:hypothetical protein